MIPFEEITAVILVGGHGRRMGGRDKSQLTLSHNGKTQTFLERLVEELAPLQMKMVLSGRASQPHDAAFQLIEDLTADCGPLGGLYSALRECPTDWVFLLACDLPHFDANVLRELTKKATPSISIIVPVTNSHNHPTVALYHKKLCPILEALLDEKEYAFQSLFSRIDEDAICYWQVPPQWEHCLHNINRPEDLEPT